MKVSAREKKTLYAGIAIAAAILIYAAVGYLPDSGALADELETQKSLLLRQRELLDREDFYKKRIEDAENDMDSIRLRLLPANNASAAFIELQRIVNDFAQQSGVGIAQRSNLAEQKVEDSDSLIKISVSITTDNGLIEDLVDFLTAVKNYDRFLKIENLAITPAAQTQRPNQNQQNMIRSSLTVVGYISAPPPEPAAKPDESAALATPPAARGGEQVKRKRAS